MDPDTISEVMRAMGRKGGQASGPARMVKMTAEQRSEVARTAAKKGAEVRSKKAAANKAGNKSKRRTESSSVTIVAANGNRA